MNPSRDGHGVHTVLIIIIKSGGHNINSGGVNNNNSRSYGDIDVSSKGLMLQQHVLSKDVAAGIDFKIETADAGLSNTHCSIVFSICPSNDKNEELGAVSDASSTTSSTCPSNDSDGELGTVTDLSINDDPISIQKIHSEVPTPTQIVDPSCAQHVKPPRQPIRTPVTSSPIPLNNRQNWNQRMQRDLGAGFSFERKPCFVCGSLSHLIKNCDYYEKKMAREAALKSKRVVHTNDRQATPAWNNTNRINKANQFTPRPVNVRPNLSTASNTIKTGRVNVNTGHGNVNSGSVHVNAGTQVKSGASRFNTGKQHVNSGSVYVNSVTQIKSAASRVNTGKRYINSGCVHINTARVNRPSIESLISRVEIFNQGENVDLNIKSDKCGSIKTQALLFLPLCAKQFRISTHMLRGSSFMNQNNQDTMALISISQDGKVRYSFPRSRQSQRDLPRDNPLVSVEDLRSVLTDPKDQVMVEMEIPRSSGVNSQPHAHT
ncbi:hypothetical protein Tco_0578840 [Tanacetum coccineum]